MDPDGLRALATRANLHVALSMLSGIETGCAISSSQRERWLRSARLFQGFAEAIRTGTGGPCARELVSALSRARLLDVGEVLHGLATDELEDWVAATLRDLEAGIVNTPDLGLSLPRWRDEAQRRAVQRLVVALGGDDAERRVLDSLAGALAGGDEAGPTIPDLLEALANHTALAIGMLFSAMARGPDAIDHWLSQAASVLGLEPGPAACAPCRSEGNVVSLVEHLATSRRYDAALAALVRRLGTIEGELAGAVAELAGLRRWKRWTDAPASLRCADGAAVSPVDRHVTALGELRDAIARAVSTLRDPRR